MAAVLESHPGIEMQSWLSLLACVASEPTVHSIDLRSNPGKYQSHICPEHEALFLSLFPELSMTAMFAEFLLCYKCFMKWNWLKI